MKDDILNYKKKVEELGIKDDQESSKQQEDSVEPKTVRYKQLKQMNYQAKLGKKSQERYFKRQNKPLQRSPKKSFKLPLIQKEKVNENTPVFTTSKGIIGNFGLSRSQASMPKLNPKLKQMYSSSKRTSSNNLKNQVCPIGGIFETFEKVKNVNTGALPKTVRDPRYIQIKKTIDSSLKKPKDYKTTAKIRKYRERSRTNNSPLIREPKNSGGKFWLTLSKIPASHKFKQTVRRLQA